MFCFIHADRTKNLFLGPETGSIKKTASMLFDGNQYHAVFTPASDMGMETEERRLIYKSSEHSFSPAAGAGGAAQMWPSSVDNRQSFLHLLPTLKWQAGW